MCLKLTLLKRDQKEFVFGHWPVIMFYWLRSTRRSSCFIMILESGHDTLLAHKHPASVHSPMLHLRYQNQEDTPKGPLMLDHPKLVRVVITGTSTSCVLTPDLPVGDQKDHFFLCVFVNERLGFVAKTFWYDLPLEGDPVPWMNAEPVFLHEPDKRWREWVNPEASNWMQFFSVLSKRTQRLWGAQSFNTSFWICTDLFISSCYFRR